MTRFDRITEGKREKDLLEKLRGGVVTKENLEEHCLPFFVKIQIQTTSACNGRCITCPYPVTRKKLPQGEMSEALFERLLDQIKGRGVERTSLFLMNEPLVDRRLDRFCARLKKEDSQTEALIYTNGLCLTGDRALSLAGAGMDEIDVSVNGFDKESHNRVMQGVDYDRVMKNLREVGRLFGSKKLGGMRVRVVGLRLPGTEKAVETFREETGLDVFLKPVTNRAGLIDTAAMGGEAERSGSYTLCQRPFVKAYVLYNGDMVLCNCDWMRTTLIGNIEEHTMEELWLSPKLMAVRRAQLEGAFPKGLPCGSCDYPYLI